ncbi:hypothetical protein Tco_0941807 [Tanacetum coccineum]|uniref:Uncharacterized protein n=1 Tax=Tanacetum coccineum TaxID=301880 RepID=A0ABQ5DUC3_9ASTR
MSTSTHPIIVPSDSDIEDAFSSTHTPDYTPASPDYFPASPGNTSPDPSDDLSKYLLASLAISPFYDDPCMKVMQAYNATSNESPIPALQAPIAPPTILPPSPVLPLSPIFDPKISFFLERFCHLRNELVSYHLPLLILLLRLKYLRLERIIMALQTDKIEGLGNGRVIIQQDFDQLETELQEARTQISGFQREQTRHDNEIALARFRISTLELIIEDI